MPARSALLRVLVLVLFVLASVPRMAMAAGHASRLPPAAAALKAQADRAMDALHYDDAVAAYRQAYEISKDPALLYNQARAYQALGDYASALDFLERFETDASPTLRSHVPDLKGLEDDVRGKVSTLTVTSNAIGAEVVLQDKVIGTTPLPGPIRTTSGHVLLVIHGDRYQEYRKELDLVGGQATTLEATLSPKDTSAVLLVRTGVAGAHVSVDGKLRGDAPLELVTLPGLHTIRLERSGYETTDTSAVLAPAARKEIDVPMVKGTPLYARWWLWTAVGVAIAGGVATYVALTTERSPDHGSISPGVISAPAPASLRF